MDKKRNHVRGLHKLMINGNILEDSQMIKDHILSFHKYLYFDLYFTSTMENMNVFIAKYIPS